jgi:hypothetical protein
VLVLAFAAASLLVAIAVPIVSGDGPRRFAANLDSYQETPNTLSEAGRGSFTARIEGNTIRYRLRFSNLTGAPTQAHIHFGARALTGGISAWLCESATNTHPTNPPDCPTSPSGEVSGVIDAADVIGPNGQGIAPGEFAELIRAMRAGATYANIHTVKWGSGEIRGQIGRGDG